MTGKGTLLGGMLLAAAAGVVWLLLGTSFLGGGAGDVDRAGGGTTPPDLLEEGAARLGGRPGAHAPTDTDAPGPTASTTPEDGLWGRVQDGRGRGLANATVRAWVEMPGTRGMEAPVGDPVATAVSGPDGDYVLAPLPEDRLVVRAQATGYAASVRVVPRRGARVDWVLAPAGALRLRVEAEGGEPVEDAKVEHRAGSVITTARTNAEGMVVLSNLPTAPGRLTVAKAGYAAVRQEEVGVPPGSTESLTVVLLPPLVLDLTVLDASDQRPVAGADVLVRYPNTPWLEPSGPIATDPDGRAAIPLAVGADEALDVGVTSSDHAPLRSWAQATESVPGHMQLELRLPKEGFAVEGQVVGPDRAPVAGAEVAWQLGRPGEDPISTTSDTDGRFLLPPNPWLATEGAQGQVVAVARGLGVGAVQVNVPASGQPSERVVLALSGAGRVVGTVRDGAGAPVAGALVALEIDWRKAMAAGPRGGGPSAWIALNAVQDPRWFRLDAVSDAEGAFAIADVPALVYQAVAEHGFDVARGEEEVTVAPDETARVEIELGEGGRIEGWVLDPAGTPVAGARVAAYDREAVRARGGRRVVVEATTLEDGSFLLQGVSGDLVTVNAAAAGYQPASEAQVAVGTTGLRLTLVPLGLIEGELRYDGRPYRGTFSILPQRDPGDARSPVNRWDPGNRARTFNADDGRFVLRGLQAGTWRLSASTSTGLVSVEPVPVRVADGQVSRVQLTLSAGATVRGRVIEDQGAEPVVGAWVWVRAQDAEGGSGPQASTRTDSEGRFLVRGLGAGPHIVQVTAPDGIAFDTVVELTSGAEEELLLRREEPGSIKVVVLDEEGKGVADLRPVVTSASGNVVWPSWQRLQQELGELGRDGWRRALQTDDEGVNVRRHLAPGTYTVTVTGAGIEAPPGRSVQVVSGGQAEVRLTVRRVAGGAEPDR